jgi:hypothetical protein
MRATYLVCILVLFLCSCVTERMVEFDNYLDSLRVGQVLDVNHRWVRLKQQSIHFSVYSVSNSYADEALIKVRNDTIINITYRISR